MQPDGPDGPRERAVEAPEAAPTASAGQRQVGAGRRNPGARIERRKRIALAVALALQRERERLYYLRVVLNSRRAPAPSGAGA